jgi:hypothetical protein
MDNKNNIIIIIILDCDYLATSYPWSMLWYMRSTTTLMFGHGTPVVPAI